MFNIINGSLYSAAVGANWTAQSIDFGSSPTLSCFAVLNVGDLEESGTLTNRIQESDTGTMEGPWTDVAGAAFTQVDSANRIQAIAFTRTKRYLRGAGTVTGLGVLWMQGIVIGDLPPNLALSTILKGATYTTWLAAIGPTPSQGVDFGASPNTDCWAVRNVGDWEEDGTFSTKMQESDTNISANYTDIPGAVFDVVDSANHVQAITFTRTKRYVRSLSNRIGDGASVTFGVSVGDLVADDGSGTVRLMLLGVY